jgi:hypothetical protein
MVGADAKKVPYGCGLSEKMYQTCISSGGCCQGTNCLFGKCHYVAPPKTAATKNHIIKKAKSGDGIVMGQIMPERSDFADGFGHKGLGKAYAANSKNWARLWTGDKKKDYDHHAVKPVQTMSAMDFLRGTGEGALADTMIPTSAPTIVFWDHDSIPADQPKVVPGSKPAKGPAKTEAYWATAIKEAEAEKHDSVNHLGDTGYHPW